MSPREIAWRGGQTLRARIAAIAPNAGNLPGQAAAARKALPPLSNPWPISYFTSSFDWQGADIPWQGTSENAHLCNLHWSRINYRDTTAYGDPKNTWELNRHQFLRQWVLNTEKSVHSRANAVSHLTLHWIEKNPCNYGINWCSSLELALRLVSWQSGIAALGKEQFDPNVLKLIHVSTVEHCRHLRQHPSLYSSANNHRVGELLGEMAAATLFPADPDLVAPAARAWDNLQIEARRQVTTDGICREQAFFYHAYTMLYLERAATYAANLSFIVPPWFTDLTSKMQTALNAVTDDNGHWFEIGDRDDGDLRALQSYESDPQPISTPAPPGFTCYQSGGYAIWKTPATHLLFRCGEFGYPSIAAHAHCDQLSVLLKINNHEILTDSGTCSYHDHEKWRRYFRGTTAHNTVRVNGEDQADYGGPFLWNTAPAGVITEARPERVVGSTNAWHRGSHPVEHRRTIEFHPDAAEILRVQDDLTPTSRSHEPRTYELIWNFGPAVSLEMGDSFQAKADRFHLNLLLEEKLFLQMTITVNALSQCVIHHGDESIPAGFYSRQFGQRVPITQLRITCHTATWRATTVFSSAS